MSVKEVPQTLAQQIEAEAREEVLEDTTREAKGKIKQHLKRLREARLVVANLEREYEVLLRTIGADLTEVD